MKNLIEPVVHVNNRTFDEATLSLSKGVKRQEIGMRVKNGVRDIGNIIH